MEPMTVGLVVLAALGLLYIWTSGARAQHKLDRQVRQATRAAGTAMRALVIGLVIGGVQWAILARADSAATWAAVLGVPALLAGVTVARMFETTTIVRTMPGGRR